MPLLNCTVQLMSVSPYIAAHNAQSFCELGANVFSDVEEPWICPPSEYYTEKRIEFIQGKAKAKKDIYIMFQYTVSYILRSI